MFLFDFNRAGGAWLNTDMRRGESIFELDPTLQVSATIVEEMGFTLS